MRNISLVLALLSAVAIFDGAAWADNRLAPPEPRPDYRPAKLTGAVL